jgi:hypothetical protein
MCNKKPPYPELVKGRGLLIILATSYSSIRQQADNTISPISTNLSKVLCKIGVKPWKGLKLNNGKEKPPTFIGGF